MKITIMPRAMGYAFRLYPSRDCVLLEAEDATILGLAMVSNPTEVEVPPACLELLPVSDRLYRYAAAEDAVIVLAALGETEDYALVAYSYEGAYHYMMAQCIHAPGTTKFECTFFFYDNPFSQRVDTLTMFNTLLQKIHPEATDLRFTSASSEHLMVTDPENQDFYWIRQELSDALSIIMR